MALTKTEEELARKKLEEYERKVDWMYLDSLWKVTVGVGHYIPNVSNALTLSFVNYKTKKKANEKEIRAAYNLVKSKQSWKGRRGSWQLFHPNKLPGNSAILSEKDIEEIHTKDIRTFGEKEAVRVFPSFNSYPQPAKLALFDMLFNIGATKFTKQKWPGFWAGLEKRNWETCAKESSRRGIQVERNNYVYNLFMKAAAIEKNSVAKEAAQ